jgi:signal transduction histidine kinase
MGLEARRAECGFPDETVDLMRTVGELFVGATERSRTEAALADAARQLEERNSDLERSNRDLEQFASIVSHDLKSPLQVVRGFVELLGRYVDDNPTVGEEVSTYISAALRGAGRMERLIDDLLAYARAGQRPETFAPVDLNAVMAEVLADNAPLVSEADARVRVDPLPTASGDVTQLRQLLQNLVSNAIKFARPGESPQVSIRADETDDEWIVSVTDNGIGIEPSKRDEIFSMFTRLASTAHTTGSGIGLAVCARVVDNHRGKIWVDDNPGGGCCFRFSLSKNPGSPA